jgi:hypothetical protein
MAAVIACVTGMAFGQGSLTPPGLPAPTMKTLDQIEARTPIPAATTPRVISQSGSYYLTGDITVSSGPGVDIRVGNVTLDLNGYTIKSTDPTPGDTGIILNGVLGNITIVNGFIKGGVTNTANGGYDGPGFNYGIYATDDTNVRVSGVSVSGCKTHGIVLPLSDKATLAESCLVRTVGSYGIQASTIKSSVATDCGGTAITGGQVSGCQGKSTGGGHGISADTADNCQGTSAGGYGLLANTTADNCYGTSTSGSYGLYATTANNCRGVNENGSGLYAFAANNCYGTTTSGPYGLYTRTANNCYGTSTSGSSGSYGLYATTANNCYGTTSGSGTGLRVFKIAIGCYGYSASGTGLHADIANSCRGETSSGTAQSVINKYNMP